MPALNRGVLEAMEAVGYGAIEQTVAFGDFTDVDATGFIDLAAPIPRGAIVLGWSCSVTTGFSGDTSAVVQVGIDGTLARYSADTAQSVLTSSTKVGAASLAASSGDGLDGEVTVRVTVTGNADFTSISAGEMIVRVVFLMAV